MPLCLWFRFSDRGFHSGPMEGGDGGGLPATEAILTVA